MWRRHLDELASVYVGLAVRSLVDATLDTSTFDNDSAGLDDSRLDDDRHER
jgi:hypothetical protein